MSALEAIIASPNRGPVYLSNNKIRCADGFSLSVISGDGAYCIPRDDCPGPFSAVEVGYPSERPEPWSEWETYCESPDNPTGTVYGEVPVALVRALVAAHGGEL